MSEFTICPGVTLWTLNPMNHALRNDFFGNLIKIAVVTLPKVYGIFGKVTVLEGFTGCKALADDAIFRIERSEGRAIKIAMPSVSDSELIESLTKILAATESKVSMCITLDGIWLLKDYNDSNSIYREENKKTFLVRHC